METALAAVMADDFNERGVLNPESMELLEPYLDLGSEPRGSGAKRVAIPHLSAEWEPTARACGPWIHVCTWLRAVREVREVVARAQRVWPGVREHLRETGGVVTI